MGRVKFKKRLIKLQDSTGTLISEVGVSPDIVVEEQNQFKMDSDEDNQLKYAVKLFQP